MTFPRRNRFLFETLRPILLLGAVCVPAIYGQEVHVQQLPAPPPMRFISKEEQTQVAEAREGKVRLRITIALAEGHLSNAEALTSQERYDSASAELGRYTALVEDALKFLGQMSRESNRTRDLYKRLELALRADSPRLTSLRRITPLDYAIRIKEIEDFTRKGRTEALNSFYGQTVVREGRQKKPADEKRPKEASPAPETKQP